MSILGKLWKGIITYSSSSDSKSTPQEAIQKLRETEEMLVKKQSHLENKIEQELAVAKKNGTRNKPAALQALKRKKRLEQQLSQIDGTLTTIELQREALENSHTNTEVLKNMRFAAETLKHVHKTWGIDKTDDLLQDITEQQDVAREISDAMSRPFSETYDEDELLAELAELEQEELDDNVKSMDGLPSVPSSTLPSTRPSRRQRASTKKRAEEDEDDMKMLASWAT